MSSYSLCTLETSRSDATPSEALAYVAPMRYRSDPDAFTFGGNLVVRDVSYVRDADYFDAVVEHACERLGIPRYATYSYQDTSDAGNARLYEQDDCGAWREVRHVDAWHESWDPDDDPAEYVPARGDDVPPDPDYARWESRHPAAALQREHDFDTVGHYTATVRDERAGVVTECPEPAVADNVHADATYRVVWQYRRAADVPPSAESRLRTAYEEVSGYRGVTVDDVAVDDRCVAVTLSAPATLSPRKAAYFIGWRAWDAYGDRWGTDHRPPTGRPDGVASADVSPAATVEAVQRAERSALPVEDVSLSVVWQTPDRVDPARIADRIGVAVDRWELGDDETRTTDELLVAAVGVDGFHSPWLVAHWLRDALSGDAHPADPVGFGGRPVVVRTDRESLDAPVERFDRSPR